MSREQREALDALGAFVDRWLTARANRSGAPSGGTIDRTRDMRATLTTTLFIIVTGGAGDADHYVLL
jgi:hypothetical protein